MARTRIGRPIVVTIGLLSCVLGLQGELALAGVGFIILGIAAAAFRLNCPEIQILLGTLLFVINYENNLLMITMSILLLIATIYYLTQFYNIWQKRGRNIDNEKWFELMHEKQLVNILWKKVKKI